MFATAKVSGMNPNQSQEQPETTIIERPIEPNTNPNEPVMMIGSEVATKPCAMCQNCVVPEVQVLHKFSSLY